MNDDDFIFPPQQDEPSGFQAPRLDLDSYLDWMRIENGHILHLGCRLTPDGARVAAGKLLNLAAEIDFLA